MKNWLYNFFKNYNVLSIIIPTYNNVEFLKECISSVITSANKCCKYEILIGIDNCDKTYKFIKTDHFFKNKYIKVYFFSKNVGPYIVRNSLAIKAKYNNILFFDSDDVMMKNTIKTLLAEFKNKNILKFKFYNFNNGNEYQRMENLSLSSIFSHGVFIINKHKFIDMNGFFGWRCGADTEFHERYLGQNNKMNELDIPVYYRRYHNNNITKSKETGIGSKLRTEYGNIIVKNRTDRRWNNPEKLCVAHSFIIKF